MVIFLTPSLYTMNAHIEPPREFGSAKNCIEEDWLQRYYALRKILDQQRDAKKAHKNFLYATYHAPTSFESVSVINRSQSENDLKNR